MVFIITKRVFERTYLQVIWTYSINTSVFQKVENSLFK